MCNWKYIFILVSIHKSCIVYFEKKYAVPIGHGNSFFWSWKIIVEKERSPWVREKMRTFLWHLLIVSWRSRWTCWSLRSFSCSADKLPATCWLHGQRTRPDNVIWHCPSTFSHAEWKLTTTCILYWSARYKFVLYLYLYKPWWVPPKHWFSPSTEVQLMQFSMTHTFPQLFSNLSPIPCYFQFSTGYASQHIWCLSQASGRVAAGRASGIKMGGMMEVGHWLFWMEWHPARCWVCLPLLSSLAP